MTDEAELLQRLRNREKNSIDEAIRIYGTYRLKSNRCSTKTIGSCRFASSSAMYWA